MHCISPPAAKGEAGISTAAPSHPQAPVIAAAASAKPMAQRRIGDSQAFPAAPLNAWPPRCQALRAPALLAVKAYRFQDLIGSTDRHCALRQLGTDHALRLTGACGVTPRAAIAFFARSI